MSFSDALQHALDGVSLDALADVSLPLPDLPQTAYSSLPSLPDMVAFLEEQFNMRGPGMANATTSTVIQRACMELEIPSQGMTLLAQARACWKALGAPPLGGFPPSPPPNTTLMPEVAATAVPLPPPPVGGMGTIGEAPASVAWVKAVPLVEAVPHTNPLAGGDLSALRLEQLHALNARIHREILQRQGLPEGSESALQSADDADATPMLPRPCLHCRTSRVLCDRRHPSCSRCLRLGYECVLPEFVRRGRPPGSKGRKGRHAANAAAFAATAAAFADGADGADEADEADEGPSPIEPSESSDTGARSTSDSGLQTPTGVGDHDNPVRRTGESELASSFSGLSTTTTNNTNVTSATGEQATAAASAPPAEDQLKSAPAKGAAKAVLSAARDEAAQIRRDGDGAPAEGERVRSWNTDDEEEDDEVAAAAAGAEGDRSRRGLAGRRAGTVRSDAAGRRHSE